MKRQRVIIEIKKHWFNDYIDSFINVYSKRFSKELEIMYQFYGERNMNGGVETKYLNDNYSRQQLLEIFQSICKNTAQRVLGLKHELSGVREFSKLMIKHYGKETVMS